VTISIKYFSYLAWLKIEIVRPKMFEVLDVRMFACVDSRNFQKLPQNASLFKTGSKPFRSNNISGFLKKFSEITKYL
jgi:hypothetical protein